MVSLNEDNKSKEGRKMKQPKTTMCAPSAKAARQALRVEEKFSRHVLSRSSVRPGL